MSTSSTKPESDGRLVVQAVPSSLFDLIRSRVGELFDGDRLLHRLLLLLFVATTLAVFAARSADPIPASTVVLSLVVGLVAGVLLGRVGVNYIGSRIRGNHYIPLDAKVRRARTVLCLAAVLSPNAVRFFGVAPSALYGPLSVPVSLAFVTSLLALVAWLIRYERKHGPVFVLKRHPNC